MTFVLPARVEHGTINTGRLGVSSLLDIYNKYFKFPQPHAETFQRVRFPLRPYMHDPFDDWWEEERGAKEPEDDFDDEQE